MSDKIVVAPTIVNDIEFYLSPDGTEAGVSVSGLARLCGVTHQTLSQRILPVLENTDVINQQLEFLKPLAGKVYSQQLEGLKNGFACKIITSEAATLIIEYYAFESKVKNDIAKNTYRTFARKGFLSWVKELTGAAELNDITEVKCLLNQLISEVKQLQQVNVDFKKLKTATITNFSNLDIMLDELIENAELPQYKGYVVLRDFLKSKGFSADKSTMHRFANLVADTYKSTTGTEPDKIMYKFEVNGKKKYQPNTSAYKLEHLPLLEMCLRKLIMS